MSHTSFLLVWALGKSVSQWPSLTTRTQPLTIHFRSVHALFRQTRSLFEKSWARYFICFLAMAGVNGRLQKELAEVGKDDSSGVGAKSKSQGDLHQLIGTLKGPSGTVYEGGVFEVDIQIPKQYPFEPPKMKFVTKVWHPNISSQTGAICLVSFISWLLPWMLVAISNIVLPLLHWFCIGHSERPMESCPDNQNCIIIVAGSAIQSRA